MKFILVIRPTRSTFPSDATPEESATVGAHFQYVKAAFEANKVQFVGRCDDSSFGLIVFDADSIAEANAFAENDPAVKAGIFSMEVREFRIVFNR